MPMENIDSFFKSRSDWIDVGVVQNVDVDFEHSNSGAPGTDWDIVIRIDGSYADEQDAEVNAAIFRGRLAGIGLLRPKVVHLKDISHE